MHCPIGSTTFSHLLSITDRDGNAVRVPQEPCERVISRAVADTVRAGLSEETKSGTAASAAGWTRPDFGKTGTTQHSKSVTFVGGVDDYAEPDTICTGLPVHLGECERAAFGGTVATRPYFAAMNELLDGVPASSDREK